MLSGMFTFLFYSGIIFVGGGVEIGLVGVIGISSRTRRIGIVLGFFRLWRVVVLGRLLFGLLVRLPFERAQA